MEKLKVLVVDDEARMRKLVKDFLQRQDYLVIEAENGEQAVDIFFEEKDIALILLDVMMPKMDGWQVTREIRQFSKVPIIMLTARADESALNWASMSIFQNRSHRRSWLPVSMRCSGARAKGILRMSLRWAEFA